MELSSSVGCQPHLLKALTLEPGLGLGICFLGKHQVMFWCKSHTL